MTNTLEELAWESEELALHDSEITDAIQGWETCSSKRNAIPPRMQFVFEDSGDVYQKTQPPVNRTPTSRREHNLNLPIMPKLTIRKPRVVCRPKYADRRTCHILKQNLHESEVAPTRRDSPRAEFPKRDPIRGRSPRLQPLRFRDEVAAHILSYRKTLKSLLELPPQTPTLLQPVLSRHHRHQSTSSWLN